MGGFLFIKKKRSGRGVVETREKDRTHAESDNIHIQFLYTMGHPCTNTVGVPFSMRLVGDCDVCCVWLCMQGEAMGGTQRVIHVLCRGCGADLYRYAKNGKGSLVKCFLHKITVDHTQVSRRGKGHAALRESGEGIGKGEWV